MRLLAIDAVALDSAPELRRFIDVDHQNAIRLTLQAIFDQQWHNPQHIGRGRQRFQLLRAGVNQGMKQIIQPGFFIGRLKNNFSQSGAIQRALLRQDAFAVPLRYLPQRRRSRLDHLARDNVRVDNGYAKRRKSIGDGAPS